MFNITSISHMPVTHMSRSFTTYIIHTPHIHVFNTNHKNNINYNQNIQFVPRIHNSQFLYTVHHNYTKQSKLPLQIKSELTNQESSFLFQINLKSVESLQSPEATTQNEYTTTKVRLTGLESCIETSKDSHTIQPQFHPSWVSNHENEAFQEFLPIIKFRA